MKYILINGKKRAGKDFFASLLKVELESAGYTAEVLSFAGPIKDIMSIALNITHDELDEFKNNKASICIQNKHVSDARQVLQNFGTEAMKKYFGEDVWVNLLCAQAEKTNADFIIVPDFRFFSEHLPGSVTVRIINSDTYSTLDLHRSENELNEFVFDYELDNTGYCLTVNNAKELAQAIISASVTSTN
jgi:hypothetical protein